jgi:SAM-dependent methyltransferase
LYKAIGAAFLAVNRVRYAVRGYRDPRPFPADDFDRVCSYDLAVVAAWLRYLGEYLGGPPDLAGRSVLELGPGADLGVGTTLLALGAVRYSALDVNPLVTSVPEEFYRKLLLRVEERWPQAAGTSPELLDQVRRTASGQADRLRYLCRPDFDLSIFGPGAFDLVVSHAALEHFDDPSDTFHRLRGVMRNGGLLVAQVDLQTHTRWIRDRDPLNLYRHPDSWYRACRFRGAPNRIRPHEYERMLIGAGWRDVRLLPDLVLPDAHVTGIRPHLAPRFRGGENQMDWLTIYLLARA